MSKKVIHVAETVDTNYSTGEITSSEKVTVFRLPKEPAYVKLYIDDIASVINLKNGPTGLLHVLVMRMDYEGYISLNPVIRDRIKKTLKIAEQTLRNYLQDLKKSGFLLPLGTNCFKVNPNYFAKGDWHSVFKQRKEYAGLELKIRYNADGTKEFSSKVIEMDNQPDLLKSE